MCCRMASECPPRLKHPPKGSPARGILCKTQEHKAVPQITPLTTITILAPIPAFFREPWLTMWGGEGGGGGMK